MPRTNCSRTLCAARVGLEVILIIALASGPEALAASEYRTLHKFTDGKGGKAPEAGLIFDQSGNLYGTTPEGGESAGTVFELSPNGDGTWTEQVLYSFKGGSDGDTPFAGVILDQAGNLYGTTYQGGSMACNDGCGTVFQLTAKDGGSWTETVIYSFQGGHDGVGPIAGLIFDQAGDLYGTTVGGGAEDGGTVFKLSPNTGGSWTESVIHRFNGNDGAGPTASLIFDQAGNLYGTTSVSSAGGYGTVFTLTPNMDGSWKEKVLHHFTGGNDGGSLYAGLAFDQTGHLYGVTNISNVSGPGVVFQLTPNSSGGWKERVIHRFRGGRDGGYSRAQLVFDSSGNLYGTTSTGGATENVGTAFKLTPDSNGNWKKNVLHRFFDHPGAAPFAGMIFGATGNLYGTTAGDNTTTFGSVFQLAP